MQEPSGICGHPERLGDHVRTIQKKQTPGREVVEKPGLVPPRNWMQLIMADEVWVNPSGTWVRGELVKGAGETREDVVRLMSAGLINTLTYETEVGYILIELCRQTRIPDPKAGKAQRRHGE